MTTRSAALLPLLTKSPAQADRAAATDRDFLRRFADDKDQAAFAALVKRHGPMVLGVCRRVLGNSADADDACQATFLVLARKANLARWRPSVASWLYATARQVALNARTARLRRVRHEGRAARKAPPSPLAQITGEELLSILDEELARLPERYRSPVVLCCLEGLTRDEAARQLGVPPATLKGQLERGRRRLHTALERRGVGLGAGLLVLLATCPAGASTSHWNEVIRATVGGDVSPTIADLARGVAANGFLKKGLLGACVLAAAFAIGFGVAQPTSTSAGQQADKAAPPKAAEKKDAPAAKPATKDENRTVTGKVIDPDDKPVASAEIIHLPINGSAAVAGKTADDGTFKVTVPMKSPGSYLFPRVAGFASSEYLMPATNTPAEKTFKLVKDTPIRGRLIDTQGKPVAGASVTVRHLSGYGDTMDGFLAAWQKRTGDAHHPESKWFVSFRSWDNRKPANAGDMFAAVTDKDGRFTIPHLGCERLVDLYVKGPGIADAGFVIVLRSGFDPTPYNRETLEKLKSPYAVLGYNPMLYPPDTAIVAEAEKPIRGVIKEIATGQPRAGVTVTYHEPRNHRMPALTGTTDADGRYEIHGAKKINEYELSVKRDPATGMIGRTVKLRDTPAYEPIVADISVGKGIVLTGRLLDDQTGDPVSGYICLGVLADNDSAKSRPEFDSPDCYDLADTKEDGVYRTVVPPGPVLLMAGIRQTGVGKGPTESKYQQLKTDPDYPQYFDKQLSGFRSPGGVTTIIQGQWCKVLKLKPDESELTFDIRFKRASRFAIKVQDADGKPLTGVIAAGNTARDWAVPETCEKDTCLVYELDTAKPRFVAFLEPKRKLVGTLTLKGDEKEPVTATLGPAGRVKGKLVNAAGQPIANAIVNINYEHRAADEINQRVNGDWRSSERKIETNAVGEFEIDVVIPGEKFAVYGRKKDRFLEPPDRTKRFTVKAGETTDLGSIKLKQDGGE